MFYEPYINNAHSVSEPNDRSANTSGGSMQGEAFSLYRYWPYGLWAWRGDGIR